jgi:Uma2 family endonuclease
MWKPEGRLYELHDGVIIEMSNPLGEHEEVKSFLTIDIAAECKRLNLPYFIPNQAFIRPPTSESAYLPDLLLLNRSNLVNEPLWKKDSTVTQGDSIPLVIEVVSTNWRVDYHRKYADYEEIGIREYWIVDYLALGAYKFVGKPKQPTIWVYSLVEGEYQGSQFRGSDRIVSPTFPELDLTAEQVFPA